ncbi:DUF6746 family protein [Alteromonas oceanisediminis]|uniref:DUF6746 family protein n=1 Tax=Alteromonas oceanisediminis TaxID=2836180 RepID=UPI001BD91A26|nr:DUF6746 family protein [Alteromonas oceanisediminis]MBT0585990.1 hypothetical protein [Alteromonas oceanisediminis]
MKLMPLLLSTTFAATLCLSNTVVADDEYQHFAAKPSEDLSSALCNLKDYNALLTDIVETDADIPVEGMVKIHELTYTLENAIQQLQRDLATIAEDLESVHKASERIDQATVSEKSAAYLEATSLLLTPPSC